MNGITQRSWDPQAYDGQTLTLESIWQEENAAKQFLRAHYPDLPGWHGPWAFAAWFLVDDLVQALACLARLPWTAARAARRIIRLVFGPSSIYEKKDKEEGIWATTSTVWGLVFDTVRRTVTLPALKLVKAFHVLNDPELDEGLEGLKLHTVQVLRGNLQYWTRVNAALKAELTTCDRLLRMARPGDPYLTPKGSAEEAERNLQDFAASVELQRLLVANPETW